MDISFAFRKLQKSVAGISMLTILSSLFAFAGVASADTFPDVDSDHYAYDAVDEASTEGWMTGYDNGDFGVDDTLTRGQAAKILVLGADYDLDTDYDAGFTDVSSSYSLEDYVNTAELYGIVGGYTDADGTPTGEFGPNDAVNRAQFAKMVVEAFGLEYADALDEFSDVDTGVWYEESPTYYVSTAWAWSVVNGYENGKYGPADSVTRGQAAIMVNNAQEPEWRVDDDDDDDDDDMSDGSLWVEVSSDTPEAMTIPSNATSVTLATWEFTADDDDVEVDGLTVHQYGVASLSSTHQVYLYSGSTRLTSGTSINSTTHTASFANLNWVVEAGETEELSVRMDMGDYTSTSEVGLEIESADMVDADSEVDGDFPAQGEKHTISTTDAGTVTIEKNGSIEDAQVGADDATIAKFKLSTATEAGGVEEVGLYLSGSVSTADVENFELWISGDDSEPVAQVDAVDGNDVIRFVLDGDWDSDSDECTNSSGFCISKGGSKSFYVTADFNTGRTSDTVKVYLDQPTDLFVRGNLYDTGMAVTRTNYDGNANSCSTSTDVDCSYMALEGGDITISSNGPSAADIATNADDVSILDFTIVSVTDVTFDSFEIALTGSESSTTQGLLNNTAANFTDVKIWDNTNDEALYAGVDTDVFKTASGGSTAITEGSGDNAIAYYLFTDDFQMEAGEERELSLTLDVANTSTLDAMTLVGTLALGSTYPQLKDSNNKTLTNSSVLVPTSAVTGKTMTVRTPTLTLSLASTPVSGSTSYVKGTQDVEFTGIVFACGTASDCRVTSVSLIGTIDEDGGSTFASTASTPGIDNSVNVNQIVGSVWLVDDDGNVVDDSSANVTTSTGLVTMDSVDFTIPAGESPVYTVVGDIKSDAFKNNNSESIAFKVTSASNVVAEDEDGSGITVSGTVNHPSATTATTYALVTNGGSITVAVDADTALEDIAVANTSDVALSTFKFTTTGEAFTIRKLAVSADQDGIADADLGEYDNQVSKVYLTYTDSNGDEVTEDASLVSGNATFSGLDLYIDKDDSATVEVTADLNSIASGESTAGDHVRLDLAFNNFDGLAESSGETYYSLKIDADVAATSDLDFGTITFVDSSKDIEGAGTAAAIGVSQTLFFDNGGGADPDVIFPVGTLLCTSGTTSCTVGTDEIWVVTSAQVDGTIKDTLNVVLLDNATADVTTTKSAADSDNVLYALPGDGYFSTTNPVLVYESKPTVTLASSSPSGTRTPSSDDSSFIFNVSANAQELVQIRAAASLTNGGSSQDGFDQGTNNDALAAITTAGLQVDGNGFVVDTTNYAGGDAVAFQAASDLSNYARVSFWMRWTDTDSGTAANFTDLKTAFVADGAATTNPGSEGVQLTNTICGADQSTIVSGEWYRCDIAVASAAAGDDFFSVELDDVTRIEVDGDSTNGPDDVLYFDQILAYNERIQVDVSTDGDIDTYANNSANAGSPSAADLKVGSTTKATGYWESTTNGASATNTAVLTLIPTTAIEIAKGTTATYTLHVNSSALINEDTGSDDPVTYSMDAGSSVDGSVTAGDFWWNETNATVKWLGNVNTKVTGNTLTY